MLSPSTTKLTDSSCLQQSGSQFSPVTKCNFLSLGSVSNNEEIIIQCEEYFQSMTAVCQYKWPSGPWNIQQFSLDRLKCPLLKLSLCRYQLDQLPSPRADPRATNFFRQNPTPQNSFSVQNFGPRVKKSKQKSPPPGITCLFRMPKDQWERNIILEKQFLSKFSIIVHLTIFFFRENKVRFASICTTLKINTV